MARQCYAVSFFGTATQIEADLLTDQGRATAAISAYQFGTQYWAPRR